MPHISGTLAMLTNLDGASVDILATTCDGQPAVLFTDRNIRWELTDAEQASVCRAVSFLMSNDDCLEVRICAIGRVTLCQW